MSRVRIEFTVEPFVDGDPGAHVLAAWRAVETQGATLTTGPFSSEAEFDALTADRVVAALVRAALTNGAERLSVQIEHVAGDLADER